MGFSAIFRTTEKKIKPEYCWQKKTSPAEKIAGGKIAPPT